MAAVRVLLAVLVTVASAAARPQDADQPPAVEVQPTELASDTATYKLVPAEGEQDLETSARALLDLLEPQSQQQQQSQALAEWAYASNITSDNEQAMVSAGRPRAEPRAMTRCRRCRRLSQSPSMVFSAALL